MRAVAASVVVLGIAAGAFAIGRQTAPNGAPEIPETSANDLTVRVGDQLQVPSAELFCVVSIQLDTPRVLCNRTGLTPRYQVIFERDRTILGRIGDPGDERVFPER
jgi:hypothetical protein